MPYRLKEPRTVKMSDQRQLGAKAGIGATAGIGGFLSLLVSMIASEDYVQLALTTVPIITPFISSYLINVSAYMLDDPESVAMRARLKKDLKNIKETLDDDYCSTEAKEQARKDYDATRLALGNVGKKRPINDNN